MAASAQSSDFGSFGRYVESPLSSMTEDERAAYDYLMDLRGQIPGPYKIMLQNPALVRALAPLGQYYQRGTSLSKAEVEIVTNVANGRWLASYSNYEHEQIAVRDGGLPPDRVAALIAGLPTSFEEPRHQIAYEVALTLAQPRVLPVDLYRRAVEQLGDEGLTDLTVLLGYFTAISMTLMAYDVPSNAVGLQR